MMIFESVFAEKILFFVFVIIRFDSKLFIWM